MHAHNFYIKCVIVAVPQFIFCGLSRSCYIVDVVFVTFIHSKILPIKTEGMSSYIEETRSVGV